MMKRRVDQEYEDILQNIESAIVSVYRGRRTLLDYDVEEALDVLIREYKAELQQRTRKPHRLSDRPAVVYECAREMCEWRLGRAGLGDDEMRIAEQAVITIAEIVTCLKYLKRSVQFWTKEGGRQGYLQFVSQYV